MKLKANNKFSKWLFKLACKFGYSPLFPKPNVAYITPRNFVKISYVTKIPEMDCVELLKKDINLKNIIIQQICHDFAKILEQNIKFTSKFNPEDNTTTVYAELYILNKKGLEDFYERY